MQVERDPSLCSGSHFHGADGRLGLVWGFGRFEACWEVVSRPWEGAGRLGIVGGVGRFLKYVGEGVSRPWERGRPIGFCCGIRPFLEACWGGCQSAVGAGTADWVSLGDSAVS